jgi:hypothetical protein
VDAAGLERLRSAVSGILPADAAARELATELKRVAQDAARTENQT